ncbi:MAG: hypothetical protein QM479_06255 [Pseudomonadota bacterium]
MNSINVRVDFSFQGKHYTPEITIELDNFIQQKEPVSFHRLIASQHEIDCYSYLYEVMESSDIFYCNPQGLAIAHTKDEYFDIDSYRAQWAADKLLEQLLLIAKKEMNIADFEQNKSLKNALLQAYNLGYSQLT